MADTRAETETGLARAQITYRHYRRQVRRFGTTRQTCVGFDDGPIHHSGIGADDTMTAVLAERNEFVKLPRRKRDVCSVLLSRQHSCIRIYVTWDNWKTRHFDARSREFRKVFFLGRRDAWRNERARRVFLNSTPLLGCRNREKKPQTFHDITKLGPGFWCDIITFFFLVF